MNLVPLLVCGNLFNPESGIRLGGTCMLATVVTVPETAMHKNDGPVFGQDNIGCSGKPPVIHTIPEASCKKSFP